MQSKRIHSLPVPVTDRSKQYPMHIYILYQYIHTFRITRIVVMHPLLLGLSLTCMSAHHTGTTFTSRLSTVAQTEIDCFQVARSTVEVTV